MEKDNVKSSKNEEEFRHCLCHEARDDFPEDVGKPHITPLCGEGQIFMVKAKAVQQSGVKVMHANGVFRDVIAEVIRGAIDRTRIHASARHPQAETSWVVVPTVIRFGQGALAVNRAAKFT